MSFKESILEEKTRGSPNAWQPAGHSSCRLALPPVNVPRSWFFPWGFTLFFLLRQSPRRKRFSCTCISFFYSHHSLSSSTSRPLVITDTHFLSLLFGPLPQSDRALSVTFAILLLHTLWLLVSGGLSLRASTTPIISSFGCNVPLLPCCLCDQAACLDLAFNSQPAPL